MSTTGRDRSNTIGTKVGIIYSIYSVVACH